MNERSKYMITYLILYILILIPGAVLFFNNPSWSSIIPFAIWCYASYKIAYSITKRKDMR